MGTVATWVLPGVPSSAGRARRLVTEEVADRVDRSRLDEVRLITSELVSEVLRRQPTTLRLVVEVNDSVRIVVEDEDPDRVGAVIERSVGGLSVVGAVAGRWGTTTEDGVRRLWWEGNLADDSGHGAALAE